MAQKRAQNTAHKQQRKAHIHHPGGHQGLQGVCVLITHGGVDVFPIRFTGKPEIGGATHDTEAKAGIAQNSDFEFLIAADFEHNIA